MDKIKRFAVDFALCLMSTLTFFLVIVASEGDRMEGWIIVYCAGMVMTCTVLLVFGLGANDE